jgi:hypothetical protein
MVTNFSVRLMGELIVMESGGRPEGVCGRAKRRRGEKEKGKAGKR